MVGALAHTPCGAPTVGAPVGGVGAPMRWEGAPVRCTYDVAPLTFKGAGTPFFVLAPLPGWKRHIQGAERFSNWQIWLRAASYIGEGGG